MLAKNKSDLLDAELIGVIRPMPKAKYEVDHGFNFVEGALKQYGESCGINLTPDYQRGHVWSRDQQEDWIEAVIRGAISSSGRVIQFNCPTWDPMARREPGDLGDEVLCIDGLQRLTAIRRYVAGEIEAFGRNVRAFDGTSFDVRRYRFGVAMHEFQTRADLLDYYLDLNTRGTPHSAQEIERVRALALQARPTAGAPGGQ